ncbi:UvrD-helicase domain-containing protein [Flavobacterium qiangtangense]|uniref:UvrD-helicase domain-containing protein n=1 Tax=Flavobacterium qiangtangense TaxID=1442595 RepID=A0ABW1PIM7_9FLAO
MSGRINKPDTAADIELRSCLMKKTSFIMIAGAGSGKTTSLIKALKFIEEKEGGILRQEGKKIACITYTTAAEKEILDDVGHDSFFHVSTIHSFLWQLIRPFQMDIKKWVIAKIQSKLQELQETRLAFTTRTRQTTRANNTLDTARYQHIAENIHTVHEFSYETGSKYLEGILGHSDVISMAPTMIIANPLLQIILSNKYPYFFIDESQDTIPDFVNAIKIVQQNVSNFCLGFFGDPMQKIYHTGSGAITLESGWEEIRKPENFRCSKNVLEVLNKVRALGDGLRQTGGRKILIGKGMQPVIGSAQIFILQANDQRSEKINLVRQYLAQHLNDQHWISDHKEADVKVLVIEHRMAASRLNFSELYSAFKDNSTDSLNMSFSEGTSWTLMPFLKYILPLIKAYRNADNFKVVDLLRQYCPLLQKNYLTATGIEPSKVLSELKVHVQAIENFLKAGSTAKVLDLLTYLTSKNLIFLDERLKSRLTKTSTDALEDQETRITDQVIGRFFNCPVIQIWGYDKYINEESPFSTQHSIKGAEFNRVAVILDDEEGRRSTSYSYEKLLGIRSPSDNDTENAAGGRETSLDRTRRLFYVCCSRALTDLAVILFTNNAEAAKKAVIKTGIFERASIKTELDIS